MINKNLIDQIVRDNLQFPEKPEDSLLWASIKMGLENLGRKCSDRKARRLAKYHCNSITMYTLFKAHGWIEFHYSTWVNKLVEAELLTEKGFLRSTLEIAKFFGFEDRYSKLEYFYDYDECVNALGLDPDKGYKMKIENNSGNGDHFMPAYVLMSLLYVSDPSKRGIRVKAKDVIKKNKFNWLVEV